MTSEILLFAGTSHPELAQQVAKQLGVSLGKVNIRAFPDEEIGVQILENVRGRDVFVLQSIARHPNLYLMEMLIIIDALKRASARSVTAVIPYFGYARQDRKDKGRVPITAKLVANLLETAGANRVLTLDLHADQVEGFFDIPVDNLSSYPLFVKVAKELHLNDPIVVAPDLGSVRKGRQFARLYGSKLAIVDKHRESDETVRENALIGTVKGREVLVVDDICSTGMTLKMATEVCRREGAKRILAFVTHGLTFEKVLDCGIERIFTTDSTPQKSDNQIEVVSIAPLLAKAIEAIFLGSSLSGLFE